MCVYFLGRDVRDDLLIFQSVTEEAMSVNGVEASKSQRRRIVLSRWAIRLLIALILSVVFILVFFSSGAVSR